METPSASWNPAELTDHAEWVRGLALHLVRDSARADDLVQETFLAALERRPDQGRSLRPWLRRVLQVRFAFGQRSEARRLAREEEGASPEGLPSSDELVENAEAHAMLVRALTKLREPYRTALLLRYFEEKSPQEIAASQGLPASTVRSHLKNLSIKTETSGQVALVHKLLTGPAALTGPPDDTAGTRESPRIRLPPRTRRSARSRSAEYARGRSGGSRSRCC